MSLIPKIRRNSQSILNSVCINFFNKAKNFRTVSAAERTDYRTQHSNNSHDGSKGGDFQQQHSNTPGNIDLRFFDQNSKGHYKRNSVPRGSSKSKDHLRKPNGYHHPVLHPEMNNVQSSVNNGTLEEMDGFCNEGDVKEAMRVSNLLHQQGIEIGLPRYCKLMKVIGEVAAKEEAKLIHNHLMKTELYSEITVQNKVLEMYLKCGLISEAHDLFATIPARNVISWDTMIVGLAGNGHGEDAIDVFTEFKESGGRPDGQMFLGVFYACSTLCDINEGMLHFESMSKVFGITPSMDHYVGVVKMLGSTGYLDEAFEFIENMPLEPSIDVWETLMNLCRIHGNLETGEVCANIVALLDPSRLDIESKAGLLQKQYLGQKPFGVLNYVPQYMAGDTSHTDNDKIYAHLKALGVHMKESGYIPELRFALLNVDDESKATALLAHGMKLACISHLLNSPARTQLRIFQNHSHRVCVDCHNALKIISKIVGRKIIAQSCGRFHHVKEGVCSCNDFWP